MSFPVVGCVEFEEAIDDQNNYCEEVEGYGPRI